MRIAVVIPAYNEEDQIKQCLGHLSKQTLPCDIAVVVNNQSTDKTASIAKHFPFVTVITEKVQGICAATFTGMEYAADRADIILRCDADSWPPKDWIEKAVAILRSDDSVVGVTGPGIFRRLNGAKAWLAQTIYMKLYFVLVGSALAHPPLFGSNYAIRSVAWKKIAKDTHLDRQDIHDDIEVSYHIGVLGRIVYDSSLIVSISHRPFSSIGSVTKRIPMAFRGIFIHLPKEAPWLRLYRKLRHR